MWMLATEGKRMQRGERQTVREGQQLKVADLRAQFRATPAKAAKALRNKPKPPRKETKSDAAKRENNEDARRDRAEKLAEERRTTSLLKTTAPKRSRDSLEEKKPQTPLFVQLLFVIALAGGVAYAMQFDFSTIDWDALKDMAGL
jgi:hypothetical protein